MTAPTKTGAEFSPVRPITDQALLRNTAGGTTGTINLGTTANTLENGPIFQVTPQDAFRPGQQVIFWLTVYNGQSGEGPGGSYISRVRLKPWWLRPNQEFRSPGMNPGPSDLGLGNVPPYSANPPGWKTIDDQTFGGGTYVSNFQVWIPSVKMLDISEFQSVNPPPAAPARMSDSLILDDIWTLDLQDPGSAGAQARLINPAPNPGIRQRAIGRSVCFLYVSHGYALGFTHQITMSTGATEALTIDLSWMTGTL